MSEYTATLKFICKDCGTPVTVDTTTVAPMDNIQAPCPACSECGSDVFVFSYYTDTTIATQAETIATLETALASQNEALLEARQFIRGTFPLEHPSDIRYANKDAAILLAKWDASVADTTQELIGYKFKVGDWVTTDGVRAGSIQSIEFEGMRHFYDVRWNVWDNPIRYKEEELEPYTDESKEE